MGGLQAHKMGYIQMRTFLCVFLCSLLQTMQREYAVWASENKEENVVNRDLVINLPGQPKVAFGQYAGYVTVNEDHGRALFYWFFEAVSQRMKKPLVLWLNGGPGCSSVGYGATQEIGPFLVNANGTALTLNKYSWNQEANLLFVESPIGVGFSYSNTSSDYDNIGDNITAEDMYCFIQNWFNRFPRYREHDFYITGESYAGKYVPELAELIHDMNSISNKSVKHHRHIKLKGLMVGNPETDDRHDMEGFVDYAWSHAVISDQSHRNIKDNCEFSNRDNWNNQNCTRALQDVYRQYQEIDMYSLYTPVCIQRNESKRSETHSKAFASETTSTVHMVTMPAGYDPCLDDYAKLYYNREDVQRALHATNGDRPKNWSICNSHIYAKWVDSRTSVLPIYHKLIAAGLRIWVYSGDVDGRVPVTSTRYCINSLGLPVRSSWRPWYHYKQVSGWTVEYEGLTFATFRGAGHAVPIFKPSSALACFRSFLLGQSLPNRR